MNTSVSADARLFRACLAASILLNLGGALLIGRLNRPDVEPPQGRPHIRLMTVSVRPSPPASARRGITVAARPSVSRPTARPAVQVRVTQATQAPTRAQEQPPQLLPVTRPVSTVSTPAPRVITAIHPARLTVPRTYTASPQPLVRPVREASRLPSTPPSAPPVAASSPPADASRKAVYSKAVQGSTTGGGAGFVGGARQETGRRAGGPFGIGDGLAAEGVTRHIVYVLDVSASMSSRISRAEEELTRALDGLRPGETFNVVAFSETSRLFDPDMAEATPAMRQSASTFLRGLEVGGDTNLEAAVARALMLRDVNEIVLLTDGVPTLGETDPDRLAGVIRRVNIQHARISTIGLVGRNPDGPDGSFAAAQTLQQIASDSGGTSKLVSLGGITP